MDHIKILKRAWAILWQYRVLWIFGIVLALTTSSGTSSSNSTFYNFNQDDFNNRNFITPPGEIQEQIEELIEEFQRLPNWQLESAIVTPIIALGIGLACVILILVVVGIIARNVAEAALIRLVDDYEQTGEKRTFREGFRMGWSKTAVRLFLINLVMAIPVILFVLLLSALTLAPLLLWVSGNTASGIFGTISTIGLGFLLVLIFIVMGIAISILLRFVRRACAIENLGVIDAYKEGFTVLRTNLWQILLMWLIMLGVQIGAGLLIIPIALLSLVVSGVVSGLLFLITRGITGLFLSGAAMWIISGVIAVPAFILLLSVPLAFVGGLIKVYESSVWTLVYRELSALQAIADKDEAGLKLVNNSSEDNVVKSTETEEKENNEELV